MTNNINNLFQQAREEGTISAKALQALTVADVGAQIQSGLGGVKIDDIQASEVVLVTMLIDDSGSIRFGSNAQAVRDGHNLVLDAITASKQQNNILAHTRYLNGFVLYPYVLIEQAARMNQGNYDPGGGTPLYDQSVVLLGTVLAKTKQEFTDFGVAVRTMTLIITDGQDAGSIHSKASNVAAIVKDMLKEEIHIVAAMGIEDGQTDFKEVFKEMGIRDEWILIPGNTPSEIRKVFQVFSQTAIRASQSAAGFKTAAAGGFGAP